MKRARISSKNIMDVSVADTVRMVEPLGTKQYKTFAEERLEQRKKPVIDIVPKNKLPLFRSVRTQPKQKKQIGLKSD